MLGWIGLALLSASWLFGLQYYHRPEPRTWLLFVGLGTTLLTTLPQRPLSRRHVLVALLLAIPVAVCWPNGMRTPVALLSIGLALSLAPSLVGWPGVIVRRLANGMLLAGCVLVVQSFGLDVYQMFTARSHELPAPLPGMLGTIATLLGIESGVHDSTVAIFSMRAVHMLGATWELLLDPVSFSFVIGGAVLLSWQAGPESRTRLAWFRRLAAPWKLLGLVALWLPVRAGLLMSIFLQGVLRTEYEQPLNSVYWFWSGWTHLAMLIVPVLLAWRFCPLGNASAGTSSELAMRRPSLAAAGWRQALAVLLTCAAAGTMTAAMLWDPVGPRKEGRVVIDEYNPDPEKVWERTDKPFDTEWYGNKSGYTYYCIYDYLQHFYDVSRLTQPIGDAVLQDCDVLVIKTPKDRPFYSDHEIENIRRFVKRGGGLLLIGEHTNVYGTSSRLNQIAERFGFKYVPDCLFGIDSVFTDVLEPPRAAHPSVQYIKRMDFATSCSLDVGFGFGRAAILATGLKNKTADYHVDNFYPQPADSADMRYGAFVQLWSTNYGQGHVLAFTDSTDFSNFCEFDPGKLELMMGMVEWLNHRRPAVEPWPWLIALTVSLACGACWAAWGSGQIGLVMLVAALLGYTATTWGVAAAQQRAMPMPAPLPEHHPLLAVMDRSVSGARFPVNGFMDGRPHGFGVFERWILRLGYFTARRPAPYGFASDVDLLVVAYPRRPVSKEYLRDLAQYVSRGGKLLVLDSYKNDKAFIEDANQLSLIRDQLDEPAAGELSEHATTNDLLEPFQMSVDHSTALQGALHCAQGLKTVATSSALQVSGGESFVWIDGHAVGAWRKVGQGMVIVIGYGDRLCDQQMGVTGDLEPDAELRNVYEWEYALVRAILRGETPTPTKAGEASAGGKR